MRQGQGACEGVGGREQARGPVRLLREVPPTPTDGPTWRSGIHATVHYLDVCHLPSRFVRMADYMDSHKDYTFKSAFVEPAKYFAHHR